ncbi:hypothetical protein QRX50_31625 [Amycolatopsis carbonis]|uniref:Lipoprotein n=1 Tax=Amycolatopsis carbonis TaxID=715471 RepID=A0A9Y2I8Z0_9PSEU|nr:hypothetical protein [Amycolatopsis sp. 2-15]WIX76010.1 hypothetical protein QRX50_31625 [Amycolatopsis sp. 2-15]
MRFVRLALVVGACVALSACSSSLPSLPGLPSVPQLPVPSSLPGLPVPGLPGAPASSGAPASTTSAAPSAPADGDHLAELKTMLEKAGCTTAPAAKDGTAGAARCQVGDGLVFVAVFTDATQRDAWVKQYQAVGPTRTGDAPVLWGVAGLDEGSVDTFAKALG